MSSSRLLPSKASSLPLMSWVLGSSVWWEKLGPQFPWLFYPSAILQRSGHHRVPVIAKGHLGLCFHQHKMHPGTKIVLPLPVLCGCFQ